jgi:hypothetical protein
VSFCYIPPPPLLKIRRPCGSYAINCQPSETSILPLRCDSSDVRNDHYTRMALCGGSAFPQYTRPLLSWDDVQKLCPGHLEVQGFLRLRGGGGEYEPRPGTSDETTLPANLRFPRIGAWTPRTSGMRVRNNTGGSWAIWWRTPRIT